MPWLDRRLERRRRREARRTGVPAPYDPGRERRAEQRARELLQVVRQRRGVGDVPRPRLPPRVGRPGAGPDGPSDLRGVAYAYLVYPHKPIVAYLPQTGRLLNEYCVEFPDETRPYGSPRLPDSDDVLAKWMALKGDERRLIAEANMHLPGRQLDPSQVQRDIWRLGRWERERLGHRARRAGRAPAPVRRRPTARRSAQRRRGGRRPGSTNVFPAPPGSEYRRRSGCHHASASACRGRPPHAERVLWLVALLALLLFGATARADAALVAQWPFDEGSGTSSMTARDPGSPGASSRPRPGSPESPAARCGFDGDAVRLPDSVLLRPPVITVAAWVRHTGTPCGMGPLRDVLRESFGLRSCWALHGHRGRRRLLRRGRRRLQRLAGRRPLRRSGTAAGTASPPPTTAPPCASTSTVRRSAPGRPGRRTSSTCRPVARSSEPTSGPARARFVGDIDAPAIWNEALPAQRLVADATLGSDDAARRAGRPGAGCPAGRRGVSSGGDGHPGVLHVGPGQPALRPRRAPDPHRRDRPARHAAARACAEPLQGDPRLHRALRALTGADAAASACARTRTRSAA